MFEILFIAEAFTFLIRLNRKHYEKILYNMRKARLELNPELFKKLDGDIWEFKTLYDGTHYRLLAFWDKTQPTDIKVVATHGFIKKKSKVPAGEIVRAAMHRRNYFLTKA